MGWIINEDQALKAKFSDLFVSDGDVASRKRKVDVRFRLPEGELADLRYPAVIIEHESVEVSHEREHRSSWTQLPYAPEGRDWWLDEDGNQSTILADSPYWVSQFPIPYDIIYTVTTYSRSMQDSIQLVAQLAQLERIPGRMGFLEIPQDGTVRRLDLLGGPELDTTKDSDGKRVFTQNYKILVSTEMTDQAYDTLSKVLSLRINLYTFTDMYN